MAKNTSYGSQNRFVKFNITELFFSFKNFFLATQSTLGIDVGHAYIKIVQLQKTRKGYVLTDYRVRAIPNRVREDLRERSRFIKEFIQEYIFQTRIKTSLGRSVISGSGVFTFSFSLPSLPEKELRGAVGIELKKRLPFQIDFKNIYYDYFITEKLEEEGGSQIFVTCIAVDGSVIDRQLEFLKSFNLRPIVINTSADALGNLIRAMGITEHIAVLEIGASSSSLNFYHQGLLQFSRDIPIGGDQLTQGILKVLVPLKEDISFDDAEGFKKQCGIPLGEELGSEFCTDFGTIKGERIMAGLRPILERLITEISRTVTFYFRTYKIDSLSVLYLTGGSSRIKNIDRFLSANLTNISIKSIERLNPLHAIKGWLDVGVAKGELVMEEAASHLSCVFGLCMDKGGIVNLVPPKEKVEQKALFLLFLARLIFPLLLLIMLGFYGINYGRKLIYTTIAKRAENQILQLTPKVREIQEYFEFRRLLREREELLNKAVGRQPLWWGILKELSNIVPEEIVINRLEVLPEKEPKQLLIEGEAMSEYTNLDLVISQFTLSLNDSPYFSNVHLLTSERDIYSPIPKARFEIVCDLLY